MITIDDLLKESLKKKIDKMIDEEVKRKVLDAYYDFATTGVGKIKIKGKKNENTGTN